MRRRLFIQNTGLLTGAVLFNKFDSYAAAPAYPVVRKPLNVRKFKSTAVENAITEFNKNVKDKELGWLFNNCFPNTLDTTVTYSVKNGRPDN